MNFRQRSNEAPSIKPFGFTGIISQNSNLTVDKSYVEKGTSFVNAFDNSNVVLKDCGSPIPSTEMNSTYVKKLSDQIVSEKDSIKLPPWVHYNVKRYNVNGYLALNDENKFVINVGRANNVDEKILKYRNNLINGSYNSDGKLVANSDYMLEYQMSADGIDTENISVTAPGTYVLSGVESSIRAVWPLNSNTLTNTDNPEINLHFMNRELVNFATDDGTEILISNIDKTDSYGEKKIDQSKTEMSYSPKTHKYIVNVVANEIRYDDSSIKISYSKDKKQHYLLLDTLNSKHYIMGPYYNNIKYICYQKYTNSQNLNQTTLVNDDEPFTLYFKLNDRTYDLYKLINNEYANSDDKNTKNDLKEFYEKYKYVASSYVTNNVVYLDKFSKITNEYCPEKDISETCYFLGFTTKNYSNINYSNSNITDAIYTMTDNVATNCESVILGFEKSEITPSNIIFYRNQNSLNLISIHDSLSCVILDSSITDSENIKNDIISKIYSGMSKSYKFDASCSADIHGTEYKYSIPKTISKTFSLTPLQFSGLITNYEINAVRFDYEQVSNDVLLNYKFAFTGVSKLTKAEEKQHTFDIEFHKCNSDTDESNNKILVNPNSGYKIYKFSDSTAVDAANYDENNTVVSKKQSFDTNGILSKDLNDVPLFDTTYSKGRGVEVTHNTVFNFCYDIKNHIPENFINGFDTDSYYLYNEDTKKLQKIKKFVVYTDAFYNDNIKPFGGVNDDYDPASRYFDYNYNYNRVYVQLSEVSVENKEQLMNDMLSSYTSMSTSAYLINDCSIPYQIESVKSINYNNNISSIIMGISELSSNIESSYISSVADNYLSETSSTSSPLISSYQTLSSTEMLDEKISSFKESITEDTIVNMIGNIDSSSITFSGYFGLSGIDRPNYSKDANTYVLTAKFNAYDLNGSVYSDGITSSYYGIDVDDIRNDVKTSISGLTVTISKPTFETSFINNGVTVYSVSNISMNDIDINGTTDALKLNNKTLDDLTKDEVIKKLSGLSYESQSDAIEKVTDGKYKNVYITKNNVSNVYEYEILATSLSANQNDEYVVSDKNIDNIYYKNVQITKNVIGTNTKIYGSYSDGNLKLSFKGNGIDEEDKNIILFFDKNCSIPFEINNSTYELLDHTVIGKKIFDTNKVKSTTVNGVVTEFNYKAAPKFEFIQTNKYINANFNDWYDVDTYINYSYINSTATNGKYVLSYSGCVPNFTDNHAILSGNTYFTIISNVSSTVVDTVEGSNEKYYVDEYNYQISSLLTDSTPENYLGYKSFSFNFMIPESSWIGLNSEMYKKNETSAPLSSLNPYKNPNPDGGKCCEYKGSFIARYRNLKSGTQTDGDAKGINRYDTQRYEVPFIAKVKDDLVKKNRDGVECVNKQKIFTLYCGENKSLNFSATLKNPLSGFTSGGIPEYTTSSTLTSIYQAYYTYNYMQFDYSRPDNDLSAKIQLNNFNIFVQFNDDTNDLIITTLKDESGLSSVNTSGFQYVWTKNGYTAADDDSLSSIADFLNEDMTCSASIDFAKDFGLYQNVIDFNNQDTINDIDTMTSYIAANLTDLSGITKRIEYLSSTYAITSYISSFQTENTEGFVLDFEIDTSRFDRTKTGRVHHLVSCPHIFEYETYRLKDDKGSPFKNDDHRTSLIKFMKSTYSNLNNDDGLHEEQIVNRFMLVKAWKTPHAKTNTYNKNNRDYIFLYFKHDDDVNTINFPGKIKYIKVDGKLYKYAGFGNRSEIMGKLQNPYPPTIKDPYTSNDNVPRVWIGLDPGDIKYLSYDYDKSEQNNKNLKKYQCFVFLRYDGNTTNYNEWLKSSGTSTNERYYVTHKLPPTKTTNPFYNIILGNLINDVKSSDDYFVTWMTLGDIMFTDSSKSKTVLPLDNKDVLTSGLLPAANYSLGSFNSGKMSNIYDVSPYVKPFDMSTNILFYEGKDDKTPTFKNNEYLIINAKKMHNEIDEEDKRPEDGKLNIKLENLYDQELILTGIIDLEENPEKILVEQKFYRNDFFEYMMLDDEKFEDQPPEIRNSYKEVRYTDMREKAPEWLVYRLNSDVDFETIDNIQIKVTPNGNGVNAENNKYDTVNTFEIPGKIKMRFNNLLFKQKYRQGISFDNVKDIDFDQKIIASSIINPDYKKDIEDVLSSRWNLGPISTYFEGINQNVSVVGENRSLDEGYLADYVYKLLDHSYYLGGDNYYNDVATMNAVNNSVNKWETIKVDSKYSDLFVFSDYSPNKVIGTPYLNMGGTLSFEITQSGAIDEDANKLSYIEKAEIAKIATDVKIVNNINALTDIPTKYTYPDNIDTYVKNINITISKKSDYICEVRLSADIFDVDIRGAVYFNINSKKATNNSGNIAVYFDGLLYDKEVYIYENEKTISIGEEETEKYNLLAVESNTMSLSNDGKLRGTVVFQMAPASEDSTNMIELHNIKPVTPSITHFGIVTDEEDFYVNDETWSRKVHIDRNLYSHADGCGDGEDKPFFALQTYEDIRSNITEIKDDDGKTTKLFVKLKLKGLRKFKDASFKYHMNNPVSVLLSSDEMVESYKAYGDSMNSWLTDPKTSGEFATSEDKLKEIDNSKYIEGYTLSASLGDTVMSGELLAEYNFIETIPFNDIKAVGTYSYEYNPQGNNEFQIEVFKKNKNENKLNGTIFYANLPTDKWYNLSLYRYVLNTKDFDSKNDKFGISLTDVTGEKLEDITSKPTEIFNIYTPNDKIIYGLSPKCDIESEMIDSWVSSTVMYNYKSAQNVEFDPCSRKLYKETFYSTNPKNFNIFNNVDSITDDDFDTYNYEGKGVSKLSNILNDIEFKNSQVSISLFANDKAKEIVEVSAKFFEQEYDFNGNDKFKTLLSGYVPRNIEYNGSKIGYYALIPKDKRFHISPIKNMEVGSIMWISTPDLSFVNSKCPYFDMFSESSDSTKEYISYFGNPQHKLPPVNYSRKILNSDYATFVYNSCEKLNGYKNVISVDSSDSLENTIVYDYTNNPNTIAFVWNNSQVTRNETYVGGFVRNSTLYWVEKSNGEYSAEIGSIYNYTNLTTMTQNIVNINADSIVQRQTTLMPVLTTPLSFEKKSDEEGIVSVNDTIIATAALGYNSNGYPLNGVMVYNSNGSVSLDTDHTTYLYIAQNENQSDCRFGATQEKPIYVDSVQGNNAAYSEKFEFVPNPQISENKSAEEYDVLLQKYLEGNAETGSVSNSMKEIFEYGCTYDDFANKITSAVQSLSSALAKVNETIREMYYYGTVGIFDSYSMYNYSKDEFSTHNRAEGNDIKYLTFVCNNMAITSPTATSVETEVFNVFYDPDKFEELVKTADAGTLINKKWETKKCFYFDGKFVPNDRFIIEKIAGFEAVQSSTNDQLSFGQKLYEEYNHEIEPAMAVIWLNDADKPTSNYSVFNQEINTDLTSKSGHAIFDNYFSCNLTGVRLTIKQEHLTTAPTFIKIYLLKAAKKDDNSVTFEWVNDASLDIDLRSSYSDEYDYNSTLDKEINHQFIAMPDNLNLTKNVFGIKFVIKEIVPQNNEYNSCTIDDIKIYSSNITNAYGQALAVEDVYVRKSDANCRNFYNMKVNEYIWQIPNNASEWKTMYDILSGDVSTDKKLINEHAWEIVSGNIHDLGERTDNITNATISDQMEENGDNFSLLNTYYVTEGPGENNTDISTILSDNYLNENENISITWKYVDYVYIYYSCDSGNSRFLLEKYFGSKIYTAVKAKLDSNIEEMNSNSAFKDRFKFSGGIAVRKSEIGNEKLNSTLFDWRSSTRNVYDWTAVYTTTDYDVCQKKTVTRAIYKDTLWNGKLHDRKQVGTDVTVTTEKTGNKSITTRSERLDKTTFESNAVVENPKYSSTESWTASFEPIQIKYRID